MINRKYPVDGCLSVLSRHTNTCNHCGKCGRKFTGGVLIQPSEKKEEPFSIDEKKKVVLDVMTVVKEKREEILEIETNLLELLKDLEKEQKKK